MDLLVQFITLTVYTFIELILNMPVQSHRLQIYVVKKDIFCFVSMAPMFPMKTFTPMESLVLMDLVATMDHWNQ